MSIKYDCLQSISHWGQNPLGYFMATERPYGTFYYFVQVNDACEEVAREEVSSAVYNWIGALPSFEKQSENQNASWRN